MGLRIHAVVTTSASRLAAFSKAIRDSTLRRLRELPPEAANWRPALGTLSFADLAHHLVQADRWLFDKLDDPTLPAMTARAGQAGTVTPEGFLRLLEELEAVGSERRRRLAALSPRQLAATLADERFGGDVTVWWVIVRGNLEHEVHHKGQLALTLRLWRHRSRNRSVDGD